MPTDCTVGGDGLLGTVVTVTELDAVDSSDVPAAFEAVTVNVYEKFESSPPTTIGEDVPVSPVAVVSMVLPFA